jgi:hypothetical protein
MTVLLARAWRGRVIADSHRSNAPGVGLTECPVAVAYQVPRSFVPWRVSISAARRLSRSLGNRLSTELVPGELGSRVLKRIRVTDIEAMR